MEIVRPGSLEEALAALASHPGALVLAGGTDVMVDINLKHLRPEVVIAIAKLPELQEIDATFIGAGVTFARLADSPHRALAEAARTVGSPQIRATGTIGGNLGTASPAGDSLPFLVAAGAGVVLASEGDRRTVPIQRFLVGPKENDLRPDELILGVVLPDSVPERQAFSKVGVRQAMTIAITNVCVLLGDGEARVAIGAVGPTVLRASEAERLIREESLTPSVLNEFQRLVGDAARPLTDHRATAEYRRHAVGIIARRALERVAA